MTQTLEPRPAAPDHPADRSSVHLLGGFRLEENGRDVPLPSSVRRLIAYLALHERPQPRALVASTLWLDTSDARAGASLRSALWRLRSAGPDVIVGDATQLGLGDQVTVDIRRMGQRARRLMTATEPPDPGDVGGFSGDVLPGWYDDWVIAAREQFRQLRLRALERLCLLLTDAGRFGEAIDAGLSAVADEPLRESAQRVVVRAHLAEGNWAEALRQYESYRRLLDDELGIEPSERMTRLIAPVLPS